MRKFDSQVQVIENRVLIEVAREYFNGTLYEKIVDLPEEIIPGNIPTMRCCVYKERAIIKDRIKLAMGKDVNGNHTIQVLRIACDECPVSGYEVTDICRGCLAHKCYGACKFNAIEFNHKHEAHINKDLCKNCGACAASCPYNAIVLRTRPCQTSCKVKAIGIDHDKSAKIDYDKCTTCGACTVQCPFGAISDKSYILEVIDFLKDNDCKTIALIAPSIAGQFSDVKLGQVISGIKELGFDDVIEVALGADMVAYEEAKELSEKGF